MSHFNFLVTISLLILSRVYAEDDSLVVPKPVMDFILKCGKNSSPVEATEIFEDNLKAFRGIPIVGPQHLEATLRGALRNDDVTEYVMTKIEEEFGSDIPKFRQREECPPTANVINIDVPPRELHVFHDRMERVLQQNNNVLLGIINNLISTKFSNVEQRLMEQIESRANHLSLQMSNEFHALKQVLSSESSASPTNFNDEIDSVSTFDQHTTFFNQSEVDSAIQKEFLNETNTIDSSVQSTVALSKDTSLDSTSNAEVVPSTLVEDSRGNVVAQVVNYVGKNPTEEELLEKEGSVPGQATSATASTTQDPILETRNLTAIVSGTFL